jgi:hypothetical protein
MREFNVEVATELVVVSVQLMMTIRPITSNRDIDKYVGSCREILRLKYDDTKELRSFCEANDDEKLDGLTFLVLNTYNKEYSDLIEMRLEYSPSPTVLLDEATISAVDQTIKLWF